MRRYRSHTPAARLRDAPARSRRRRRAALAGSAVVFAVVLGGVAISVSGPPRVSTAAWTGGSGQEAGPDLDADADTVTRPPTPDGHVHLDEAGGPHRLPAGWADVPAVLTGAVDAAGDNGLDLSLCVRAIDSPTAPMRCAGGVERAYAASVTKLAYAVGALEAWEGDAEAETPLGATVGDLVDQAISVSDNEAADLLALLSASGPGALDADPFTAINTVTARVGLDDDFHSGNYYTEDHWYLSADESSSTPRAPPATSPNSSAPPTTTAPRGGRCSPIRGSPATSWTPCSSRSAPTRSPANCPPAPPPTRPGRPTPFRTTSPW